MPKYDIYMRDFKGRDYYKNHRVDEHQIFAWIEEFCRRYKGEQVCITLTLVE